MTDTDYSGPDRRGPLPGRRFSDSATCPFHKDQSDSLKSLWIKTDKHIDKAEIDDLESVIRTKLDKWVFVLFVSSISVLIIVASSIFGYVAVEALHSTQHIAVLQVNQDRLLKFFDIPSISDPEKAQAILDEKKTDEK